MRVKLRRRESGVTLLIFAVGLFAVLAMSGFALDLGRAYLRKTQLQNALDAAALDGAQVLFNTGSTAQAQTAAMATYAQNLSTGTPVVTFSAGWPFGSAGAASKYVKVEVTGLPLTALLSATFLGADTFSVSGSAVAGPQMESGSTCGVPMAMCGTAGSADTDCTDGNGCYGISNSNLELKDGTTGPGNFGLMQMTGGGGAAAVTEGMAGTKTLCTKAGDSQPTQPGNATSTTANGLNTRFGAGNGQYADQSTYPPDVITTSPMTYSAYKTALQNGSFTSGVPRRRTILVPVVNCSTAQGQSQVTVLGKACIFLNRQVPTSGTENGTVYAEMISDPCPTSSGTPSNDPNAAGARIVLYQSGSQS